MPRVLRIELAVVLGMSLGTDLAEEWAVGTACTCKAAAKGLGIELSLPLLLCCAEHGAVPALPFLIALHVALVLCTLLGLL